MMFINHCPDPSLAMAFQLKALEQQTAAEVQEHLDSQMRCARRAAAQTHHAVGLSAYSQSSVADSFYTFSSGMSQGELAACQSGLTPTSLPPSPL